MPDLVFLDTQLPDMTGDEWFEKVRAQKLDIPVVMVSAQDEIDRADAMTAPVIIARDEPLQRSEVLHLIQRVCGI
jgi:DNA-binding response OmpR family regulator